MSPKIKQIAKNVKQLGDSSYLWVQTDTGRCILWSSEEESVGDDGANAVAAWDLSPEESEELMSSDICVDQLA